MRIRSLRGAAAAMLIVAAVSLAACGLAQSQPSSAPSAATESPASGSSSARASTEAQPSASSSEREPASAQPSSAQSTVTKQPAAQESGKTPSAPPSSPSASPAPSSAKPAETSPPAKEASRTITLSIVGNAEWGSVLAPQEVELRKNDTVADLLIRTLKAHKLAYDTSGSGALFYVAGIDGLFEFDDGPTSGWKFKVNGKAADVGAGAFEPKAGDRVEWIYASQDKEAEEGKEQAP